MQKSLMSLQEVHARGGYWERVVAITEHGLKGQPKRVDIECVVCGKRRNIATQDLFQVRTCGDTTCKRDAS
jgi:hypothetical protein